MTRFSTRAGKVRSPRKGLTKMAILTLPAGLTSSRQRSVRRTYTDAIPTFHRCRTNFVDNSKKGLVSAA